MCFLIRLPWDARGYPHASRRRKFQNVPQFAGAACEMSASPDEHEAARPVVIIVIDRVHGAK
jgi:hypothetical protein